MTDTTTKPRTGPRGQRPRGRSGGQNSQSGARGRNNDRSGGNRGAGLKARFERCMELARSAAQAGDEVTAEGHYQHAEHFFRLMNTDTA